MSRVVIDARELRISSGRYVERLLHYLQQLDMQTDYQVLLQPQDLDWQPSAHRFHKIACPHIKFSFAEQLHLRKQIKNLRADLVHFTFSQQPIWYRGKTVTTVHDLTTVRFANPAKNWLLFRFKQRVYKYVVKRAVRKAEFVITPSQFVRDDIVQFAGIDPAKVVVTYEAACRFPDPPEPLASVEGQPFIVYVGRPTPHKNLERLVKAFSELQPQHPKLKLVLGGQADANYQRLIEKVKRRGVENVVFTGFLREGQLRWLYENCAAYVVPSLSEGFGLPGLEAMAHGAPVVSSNATCLPEIYGEAAQYFDPLSVEAITEAINEVLTRQDVRAALTSAGTERVKKFSWQRMAEQTLEVYDQALQTPPQGDGPLPRRRQLPHRGLGDDRSADHPPDQQPSLQPAGQPTPQENEIRTQ